MTAPPPAVPNPGSDAAIARGCSCPVLDNAHGRGAMGIPGSSSEHPLFWTRADCPLHGTPTTEGTR